MIKVLVPIDNFSWLTLTAAYFAIEFAKRNPAKILVLIFADVAGEPAVGRPLKKEKNPWESLLDELLQRGRQEKINLELYRSDEAYLTGVSRFARERQVTDIILAVPPVNDEAHQRILQNINILRRQVQCQLITVKAKEEGTMIDAWKEKIARYQQSNP